MDRILVSTVVYRPPEEVFPYVRSFTDYPRYTEYLKEVTRHGDGGPGTLYDLRFAWWKLGYTVRSEVIDVTPPESIEWRLARDVDAEGEWRVVPEPESAPADEETASRLYFEAVYDPHSADEDTISLPRFVSLGWVIDKVRPRVLEEAQRVLSRLVADVEGEPREVELTLHDRP
ncbi:SRPBCC family protein [Salinilacihabitans rarus]|uniref:SRPBCC family protein n=1 Tax=Salinilacihabitans rarus TaxID=2961596 RepID=UPI0020C926A6|nr:SRPBCC family protein [Salinilacihabitans rarus]